MRAQNIGRALGIGLRVAGRIAGQRLAGTGQTTAANASPTSPAPNRLDGAGAARRADTKATGRVAGLTSRGVVRGVGGFLSPFRRVGGIIWLEVMGVFFLLPAVVFAPTLWRVRANWSSGPDHRLFLVTAGIIVVFLYLSATSFWRAWKR